MVTIATDLRNRPHALYRFFDADGQLLYVGLTADPGARWKTHSKDKAWWADVARVAIEHFPDRESVEVAEIEAIKTENPLHNVVHVTAPVMRESWEEAGIDWDAPELAEIHALLERLERDGRAVVEAIEALPDPQRAYELATMLANAKRQETGIATATRLRQVKRLWESANMTLTELGKRLGGVTKQRAKRMLQTAETPPADS